jgi:hypothetical protein
MNVGICVDDVEAECVSQATQREIDGKIEEGSRRGRWSREADETKTVVDDTTTNQAAGANQIHTDEGTRSTKKSPASV